jgi:hypothetical protein
MRMFRRQAENDDDGNAATTRVDRGSHATSPAPDATDGRRWHHGPTRALVTLIAVGVAGLLAWLTTNISDKSTGGYWAVYGILAGAGLVMALSQVVGGWTKWGRPSFSPTVFLLAFVPTAVAIVWIMVFHQPHSTLFRGHVTNWSGDLGIAGFVRDMGGDLLTIVSFGLGLVFGLCFDTTRVPRRTGAVEAPVARPVPAETDADQTLTRDHEPEPTTVRS